MYLKKSHDIRPGDPRKTFRIFEQDIVEKFFKNFFLKNVLSKNLNILHFDEDNFIINKFPIFNQVVLENIFLKHPLYFYLEVFDKKLSYGMSQNILYFGSESS